MNRVTRPPTPLIPQQADPQALAAALGAQPAQPSLAAQLGAGMSQMGERIGNALGGPNDPSETRRAMIAGLSQSRPREYRNIFDGLSMLAAPMLQAHLTNREETAQDAESEAKRAALAQALQGRVSPDQMALAEALGDQGMQALAAGLMSPERQTPITLRPNETLIDPNTYEPLAQGAPKPVDPITPYQQHMLDLRREQNEIARQRANRPDSVVNINNAAESKFAEEQAKIHAQRIQKEYESARLEESNLNNYARMLQLLESGLKTGWGAEAAQSGKSALKSLAESVGINAQALGIDSANLANADEYRSLATKIVLNAAEQMTGVLSETDLKFLRESNPSLTMSEGGNRQIIENLRRAAQRKIERAVAMEKWGADNNNLIGFEESWRKYSNENPIFPEQSQQPQNPDDLPDVDPSSITDEEALNWD